MRIWKNVFLNSVYDKLIFNFLITKKGENSVEEVEIHLSKIRLKHELGSQQ